MVAAPATHTHNYEPAFSKNNAFNKNFGTAAGTVAEGNHSHAGVMRLYSRCEVIGTKNNAGQRCLAGTDISYVLRLGEGVYKIVHYLNSPDYVVILTGTRTNDNYDHPVFAAISEQAATSFVVRTADDNSPNDSIFVFTMLTY